MRGDDTYLTPRETVDLAVRRWGPAEVVVRCVDLLGGSRQDHDLVAILGGTRTPAWLAKPVNHYWQRVWGARALLHNWNPAAVPAVVAGLADDHWRVREMCAKVAAAHEIGEAADALAGCVGEEGRRVRVAALRALSAVGEAEQVAAVRAAALDPDQTVQHEALRTLSAMQLRLDRPLTPADD